MHPAAKLRSRSREEDLNLISRNHNRYEQPLPIRPWRKRASTQRANVASDYLGHALVVIIGVASPFTVRFVGSLPMGELLLLICLPLLLILRGKKAFGGRRTVVIVLIFVWLVGQIITDVYRHTDRYDWMRGQATIVFFLVDFFCFAILTKGSTTRKLTFFVAFSIGSLLALRYQPNELASEYPWKFGFDLPVTILFLLIASYFYRIRAYSPALGIFGFLVFLNLIFNYRSEILFLFITIVLAIPLIPERLGRLRLLPRRDSVARILVLAVMAATGAGLALLAIGLVTSSGGLGQRALQKNKAQFHSRQGILLTGRPEILVSSQAVIDDPILGHGSWAKDPKYAEMLYDLQVRNGESETDIDYVLEESKGLIPAHSHLMGAWVFSGIAGAFIWIYLFWITAKAVYKVYLYRPSLIPLYGWLFTSFLWAILFSPFGSTVRITEAVTINIVIDLLNTYADKSEAGPNRKSRAWKRKIPNRQVLQHAQ